MKEKASETLSSAGHSASEIAGNLKQKVQEKLDSAARAATEGAANLKDKILHKIDDKLGDKSPDMLKEQVD